MHLVKFRLDQIQNGLPIAHYSLSHGRYLVNRATVGITSSLPCPRDGHGR